MTWFSRVLDAAEKLIATKGEDFVLHKLQPDTAAGAERKLLRDEEYVVIRVRSSRIVNVRKGFGKFYGSVQSRVTYLHGQHGEVEFQRVIVPELRELDSAHVDRVIVVDKPVIGPVPYLGELSLELGLFSVKGSDLAAPYLGLLSSIADVSGVAALKVALPYVELLRKGADQLFGNNDQATMEIGMDRSWPALTTGSWLLMRAPKAAVAGEVFTLDPQDGTVSSPTLDLRDYPYLVFTIEGSDRRDDWMTIPDLKAAWDAVGISALAGRTAETAQLLRQFETLATWSPDLVPADAKRLAAKALAKVPTSPALESVPALAKAKRTFPRFEELDLYGPS